jgi:hypothetical protein
MAGPTLRDRIYTRPVAHAMTSPAAILATGGGVAAGILAGLPVAGAVVLGAVGWSLPVTRVVMRTGRPAPGRAPLDPVDLREPWRSHVETAIANRARAQERVDTTAPGPLRDRLQQIVGRVDTAVHECWQIARRGDTLADARRAIATDVIDRQIRELEESLAENPGDERLTAALASRQAQADAARRLDDLISDTDSQLRLMDARLGEVVVRSVELSAQVGEDSSLTVLSTDVESLVNEMEALRQALDETHSTG